MSESSKDILKSNREKKVEERLKFADKQTTVHIDG